MTCAELPTKWGAVVRWSYYYDGPNHMAATLTFDRIFEVDEKGEYVYEADPEWPQGYKEREEAEEVVKVRYEGPCWSVTGQTYQYTPEEFAKKHRIDHDWLAKYHPDRMTPRDQHFNVDVVFDGVDPK